MKKKNEKKIWEKERNETRFVHVSSDFVHLQTEDYRFRKRKKERKRERERKQEIKIKIKWNIGIILSERDYVVFDRGMNRNLARCWFAENQLSVHIQFPLTEVESDRYCIGISELPFG